MLTQGTEQIIHDKDTLKTGKRSGLYKILILLIALSALILIPGAGLAVLYMNYMNIPYNAEEIAKVKAKVAKEWDAGNAVPQQDNGWFQYKEASIQFKVFLTDPQLSRIDELFYKGLTPGDLSFIESLENDKILSLVDEGYMKPDFEIPMDYVNCEVESVPVDFTNLYRFSGYLVLLGDCEREKGNHISAGRKYLQALYMGQGMARNCDLGRFSYGAVIEHQALIHLRAFLNETDEIPLFYKKIAQEMERIGQKRRTMAEIFECQLAVFDFAADELSRPESSFSFLDTRYSDIPPMLRRTFAQRDLRENSNFFLKLVTAATGPYKETYEAIKKQTAPKNHLNKTNPSENMSYIPELYYRTKAEYGGVQILAALKWYQKEKGEYPDSLSGLTPGYLKTLPQDPFADDGNYRYKKSGDSILLYSIGPDLRDDQCRMISKAGTRAGDIVFAAGRSSSTTSGKKL